MLFPALLTSDKSFHIISSYFRHFEIPYGIATIVTKGKGLERCYLQLLIEKETCRKIYSNKLNQLIITGYFVLYDPYNKGKELFRIRLDEFLFESNRINIFLDDSAIEIYLNPDSMGYKNGGFVS